jgi:hypothetical protein
MMISNHPYVTWPLHVKLFTEEAVKGWDDAKKVVVQALPLPPGFTCSIELEGVDGKSGKLGSGRKGPINVKDGMILLVCQWYSLIRKQCRNVYISISCKEYRPLSHQPPTQLLRLSRAACQLYNGAQLVPRITKH